MDKAIYTRGMRVSYMCLDARDGIVYNKRVRVHGTVVKFDTVEGIPCLWVKDDDASGSHGSAIHRVGIARDKVIRTDVVK